jgi:hypothetical protein
MSASKWRTALAIAWDDEELRSLRELLLDEWCEHER